MSKSAATTGGGRVEDPAVDEEFCGEAPHAPEISAISVHGLPEIYREQIRTAQLVTWPETTALM